MSRIQPGPAAPPDGSVTTNKLADAAVTNAKIASVSSSKVSGLATVATSGAYADLSGKPTIPAAASTTPADVGAAAVGTASTFARADHVHALPSVGTPGTYGSSSAVPRITVDAQGRLAAVEEVAVASGGDGVGYAPSGTLLTQHFNNSSDGAGSAANFIYAIPFVPVRTVTVDAVAVFAANGITAGTSSYRYAIYSSDATGYPSARMAQTAVDSSAKSNNTWAATALSASQQLTAGAMYWLCLMNSGSPSIFNEAHAGLNNYLLGVDSAGRPYVGLKVANTFASGFPATFPAGATRLAQSSTADNPPWLSVRTSA